jgi:hypothetical protein
VTLRVISLGAGVQSTAMALMAAHGEIAQMPDCAIFADTQWEPAAVYTHLAWLKGALPFPVHVVTAGDIRANAIARKGADGHAFASIPWFTLSPGGKSGMGRRECTDQYKLRPIKQKVVELMGGRRPAGGVEMWLGISKDEASRMKPSRVGYIENRWPLIELGLSRRDCLAWMEARGYPKPPRSACVGCPFRTDADWRLLTPAEFASAVEVDKVIRSQPGERGQQFAHQRRIPLDQVDLSTAEERGQLNLFENECEGMCGL